MEELILELKNAYGVDGKFREGQAEAIRGVLQRKRYLVVQKTGWGKSLVYFLATKIMRKRERGITLIISPLLALMDNQVDSAKKLGLHVQTINSSNVEAWDKITNEINNNEIDALIISPERLSNEDFKQLLNERLASQISLFVVDEAHCISDWGHDFRPDYRRIVDIINRLPPNISVLATTATANNREAFNIIKPRKMWPKEIRISDKNKIPEELLCETGRVLSNYGDAGWGKLVISGKYKDGNFDEQLVDASYKLLREFVEENNIKWVTNISSKRRPLLVKNFTERLAKKLELEYLDVIEKTENTKCQKELHTSYKQFENAYNSFEVKQPLKENVLLVDDMVDSRWTFVACGYKLRFKGSGKVFPFALANSAGRNGDD